MVFNCIEHNKVFYSTRDIEQGLETVNSCLANAIDGHACPTAAIFSYTVTAPIVTFVYTMTCDNENVGTYVDLNEWQF